MVMTINMYLCKKISVMTEEQLKKDNPWKKVADLLDPSYRQCLYGDSNEYVLENDRHTIVEFNNDNKDHSDRIILQTPPEPWRGNPLEANLIILSLNPGYDVNINKTLAKLLQDNDAIREGVVKFRKNTLNLEAHSFLPEEGEEMPISVKEAEDILGGWYWTKRLKKLQDESGLSEREFYKRVAVLQFFGYSSTTCEKGFLCYKKHNELPSQGFNRQLIKYIIENKSDNVRFLIIRAKQQWVKFLNKDDFNLYSKYSDMFLEKTNKGRSQSITRENLMEKDKNGQLKEDIYEKVLKTIKGEPLK